VRYFLPTDLFSVELTLQKSFQKRGPVPSLKLGLT
jgi:hypothetical protein